MDVPLIVKYDSTIGDVCENIHRTFRPNFRYAMVWRDSAKFPGQTVGIDHVVRDGDVVTIIVRR
ncbi:MAG: TGS domain-containing protein [Methanomassiliicoccaceae archaeon]|nr:TGS domain-containing protein [Methanomassiliicoccaceae archaeon]